MKNTVILTAALMCAFSQNSFAKPLKVFILAGQSNMEGPANINTFDYIGDDPATAPMLKKMRRADGKPTTCDGAWISYLTGANGTNFELHGKLTAGYGNIEGVDQTCFLAMSERAMIEMCQQTGRIEMMRKFERNLAKRTGAIRTKMWDPETKFFYSLDRDTDKPIRVRTLQGFLALTAGMASAEQAGELVRQLTDPSLFWSKYPVTTSAMNEPTFRPDGFWRGDVWPPTNYLIALGLARYGYYDLGREMASIFNSWMDDAVKPGTTYRCTVKARDIAGNLSPDSNPAAVTTLRQSP